MEAKTKKAWMDLIAARAKRRVRYAVEVMGCWMYPDQTYLDENRNLAELGQEHGITPNFIKDVFFGEGGMLEGEMPYAGLDYLEANPDDMTPWMEYLDDQCSDGNIHWAAALDEVLTAADWDADTLEEFVHMTETRYLREAVKSYKDRMFDFTASRKYLVSVM